MSTRRPIAGTAALRWDLAGVPAAQGTMFETVRREVGTGEYRGMEFLQVEAKKLLNEVKGAGPGNPGGLPFHWTVNPYRGCSHACSYCTSGDTPILMADGTHRPMADLRPGDRIYGTEREGRRRRYVPTEVLDHWRTEKEAWRITLADGTVLVASGDHRFLTEGGWKHVAPDDGPARRPFLTTANAMIGTGAFPEQPEHDDDYRRGYLCGTFRSDGTLRSCTATCPRPNPELVDRLRPAPIDDEPLERVTAYLADAGVDVQRFELAEAAGAHQLLQAVRAPSKADLERITDLVAWPADPSDSWHKGFLAGIFDAEGSSNGVIRIADVDGEIVERTVRALDRFSFDHRLEHVPDRPGVRDVRVLGGFRERLRFFQLTDTAIVRTRTFDGLAVESDADLRVVDVQRLGITIPMYDITTGTGDFIANGVVSHNCFARPTHTYLGLGAGADFDQRVVVKVNAVERLRAELRPNRWAGDLVAMGTNTDPYQRCEGKYRLTRGLIEVLIEHDNPFSILTKSTLILRDQDLLAKAAERGLVQVSLSVGTVDEDVWRATEPGTPPPARRLRAVEQLNAAGIPTGVLIAPILPGVSDSVRQLEAVARAVVASGARTIGHVVLHLRSPETRAVYLERLAVTHPEVAAETDRRYRGGALAKVDRARIAAVLRGALEEAGGHLGAMEPAPAPVVVDRPARRRPGVDPSAEQLGLPL